MTAPRIGFDPVTRGEGDVVSGWKNELQSALANIMPAAVLARQCKKMPRRDRRDDDANGRTVEASGPNSPWGASWGPREPSRTSTLGAARRCTETACERATFLASGDRDSRSRGERASSSPWPVHRARRSLRSGRPVGRARCKLSPGKARPMFTPVPDKSVRPGRASRHCAAAGRPARRRRSACRRGDGSSRRCAASAA